MAGAFKRRLFACGANCGFNLTTPSIGAGGAGGSRKNEDGNGERADHAEYQNRSVHVIIPITVGVRAERATEVWDAPDDPRLRLKRAHRVRAVKPRLEGVTKDIQYPVEFMELGTLRPSP